MKPNSAVNKKIGLRLEFLECKSCGHVGGDLLFDYDRSRILCRGIDARKAYQKSHEERIREKMNGSQNPGQGADLVLIREYGDGLIPIYRAACGLYLESGHESACKSSSGNSICGFFGGEDGGYIYCLYRAREVNGS